MECANAFLFTCRAFSAYLGFMVGLTRCRHCGKKYSKHTAVCPYCETAQPAWGAAAKVIGGIIIAVLLVYLILQNI